MKYPKIFVPVSGDEEKKPGDVLNTDMKLIYRTLYSVIIFTPEELKELLYEYQSTTFRSDKITTIEQFLQSKGLEL